MDDIESLYREPCPWRIVDDAGGGFAIGAIGGGIFSFYKGIRFSSPGFKSRAWSGVQALKARGPVYGGNFAVWGGLFSTMDCCLMSLRGKEDPWNSVVAGATASGMLALRTGMVGMIGAAIGGAIILGLIESIPIAMTRYQATQQREMTFQQAPDPSILGKQDVSTLHRH
ncbi:Mitochondrial import inner membrane translocase subunit tim17 [Oopsacas minuta]|uniref:Mitochondrial import inner membrane translocase subunit tim17 n=1 Tax=Oopsacas minuta TaxID=111878 RepID=A0AAV7K0S4_9METZ|nr:Mitochondrial import inner membrane translocase subunit tim17 [Oopsacas minuta]